MNEIRRHDHTEEIDRIREIVARHRFPDFVTGFEVTLGEFDGDPAMWVTFQTVGGKPPTREAQIERTIALSELRDAVHRSLLEQIEGRYPYYRFADSRASDPARA